MPVARYLRLSWKIGIRLFVVMVVLAVIAAIRINVATVDLATSQRSMAEATKPNAAEDWPARGRPKLPQVSVVDGPGPEDKGAYKNCRVLFLDNQNGIDTYLLVTSLPPRVGTKSRGTMDFNTSGRRASRFSVQCVNQLLLLGWVMPATVEPIGTLLYLSGIDVMSDREQALLDSARERGWNIVATSVDFSFASQQTVRANANGEAQLAARIDSHLAERAYAMESMLAMLEGEQPDILSGPKVLVGMSAGAIAAPTVAARLDGLDAAVLIGAGQNVAEIMLRSPLFQHHTLLETVVSDGDPPTTELVSDSKLREEFANRTHELCRLDPSRMANSLAGVPALVVHARYDKIVPSSTGEALYRSLGGPERWTYSTGHLGLCVLLSWKSNSILDWIEQQVQR